MSMRHSMALSAGNAKKNCGNGHTNVNCVQIRLAVEHALLHLYNTWPNKNVLLDFYNRTDYIDIRSKYGGSFVYQEETSFI